MENTSTLGTVGGTPAPANGVCPNCGYCPHCGRGGHQVAPWIGWPPPYWYGNGTVTSPNYPPGTTWTSTTEVK